MSKLGIFMAEGCEEIEGLTVVDLLRRAGIAIDMIALSDICEVTGSHGICFKTDTTIDAADYSRYDGIVLPGGMPGTTHLSESEKVSRIIQEFSESDKLVAAICAAPSVLGQAGILQGKKATCYPGFEDKLAGAECQTDAVVVDGNIITSRGMGTAIPFALAIAAYFLGDDEAERLGKSIIYSSN